jgi:hypothetical protein
MTKRATGRYCGRLPLAAGHCISARQTAGGCTCAGYTLPTDIPVLQVAGCVIASLGSHANSTGIGPWRFEI